MNEPNEMYETRQVMLAQGRQIAKLEEAMTIVRKYVEAQVVVDTSIEDALHNLDAQINGLTMRYEGHYHDMSPLDRDRTGEIRDNREGE